MSDPRNYQEQQYSAPQGSRTMPHNTDAERSVLGAILLDNRVLDEIASMIRPTDFFRESHRLIYKAILDIAARGEALDVITIGDQLLAEDKLDDIGGPSYLNELSTEVPSAANVGHYGNIVRRKSSLRDFIATADTLMHQCYDDVPDVEAFMDDAERALFEITQRGVKRDYSTIKEVVKEAFTQIESLYQKTEHVTGISSGFVDVDEKTAGWQPSDLIIIAARPAMGKTSLALNMLSHAAVERGVPAAFFSLEMSNAQLAVRMLCSIARIDQSKLRRGNLSEQEWARLIKAAGQLSKSSIFLDDTPSLPIMEFRSKCRRLKSEHDIGIVFVDYLQLMRGSASSIKSGSREQEISEISRNLKAVAKELNIPVIALAQLNRGVESRADKRPMISDLRESGAIEQDADIITFVYRDEVYNPDNVENKGLAELIIGKHRNGPTGTVDLRFFGEYTRFDNFRPVEG